MAQCIGCTADEPIGLQCTIHNISVAMVVYSHCTAVHVGIGRHSILHLTTIAHFTHIMLQGIHVSCHCHSVNVTCHFDGTLTTV